MMREILPHSCSSSSPAMDNQPRRRALPQQDSGNQQQQVLANQEMKACVRRPRSSQPSRDCQKDDNFDTARQSRSPLQPKARITEAPLRRDRRQPSSSISPVPSQKPCQAPSPKIIAAEVVDDEDLYKAPKRTVLPDELSYEELGHGNGLICNNISSGKSRSNTISPSSGNYYGLVLSPSPLSRYHNQALNRPFMSVRVSPSKWDDAEKWLTSSEERARQMRSSPGHSSYDPKSLSPPPTSPLPLVPDQALRHRLGGENRNVELVKGVNLSSPVKVKYPCNGSIAAGGMAGSPRVQAFAHLHPLAKTRSGIEPGRPSWDEDFAPSASCIAAAANNRQSLSAIAALIQQHSERTSTADSSSSASSSTNKLYHHEHQLLAGSHHSHVYETASDSSSSITADKASSAALATRTMEEKACGHSGPAMENDTGTAALQRRMEIGTLAASRCGSNESTTSPPSKSSPARHNTPAKLLSATESSSNLVQVSSSSSHNGIILAVPRRSSVDRGNDDPAGDSKNMILNRSTSHWSSREEEEEESVKSLRDPSDHVDVEELRSSVAEARASAWEESQRAKCLARSKCEEARIEAWEKLKKTQAEDELKKLEAKLEKMKQQGTEKIMNKVAAAQKRAEEMKATAKAREMEELEKLADRGRRLRTSGGGRYAYFLHPRRHPHLAACACFSCTP